MADRLKLSWCRLLAWLWNVPCSMLPASWWIDHNGWRVRVWVWCHAILYGLNDRVTGLEREVNHG